MKQELVGHNEDGSPRVHYTYDGPEGGGIIKTGPIRGTVRLADGTEYKLDARNIPEEIVFAPPATGPMFTGRDKYRYDRNGRIYNVEG